MMLDNLSGLSEYARRLLSEYRGWEALVSGSNIGARPYDEFPNELDYSDEDLIGGGTTIEEIIEKWKTRGTPDDAPSKADR